MNYNHVRLSPHEAAIYLGIDRRELRDWARSHRLDYCELTPWNIDTAMGWPRTAKPPPHPAVLDTGPPPRASMQGWKHAEPAGTSDGTANKYRQARSHPGQAALAAAKGVASSERKSQSRR